MVAFVFLLIVQFWKIVCANMAKIATFANAQSVDMGTAVWVRRLFYSPSVIS